MVMSCFRIFQEDEISISTATFMNMKKRSLMSMPSLIGQPPIINIYWVPAMDQAVIMGLSQVISLILEVDIIIAILKVMKSEFTEIKWFVQMTHSIKIATLNLSSNTFFCVCILCTVLEEILIYLQMDQSLETLLLFSTQNCGLCLPHNEFCLIMNI